MPLRSRYFVAAFSCGPVFALIWQSREIVETGYMQAPACGRVAVAPATAGTYTMTTRMSAAPVAGKIAVRSSAPLQELTERVSFTLYVLPPIRTKPSCRQERRCADWSGSTASPKTRRAPPGSITSPQGRERRRGGRVDYGVEHLPRTSEQCGVGLPSRADKHRKERQLIGLSTWVLNGFFRPVSDFRDFLLVLLSLSVHLSPIRGSTLLPAGAHAASAWRR